MIERLGEENGWESTKWHTLVEIALSENVTMGKFAQDTEYYYLKCLYERHPEIYRMER